MDGLRCIRMPWVKMIDGLSLSVYWSSCTRVVPYCVSLGVKTEKPLKFVLISAFQVGETERETEENKFATPFVEIALGNLLLRAAKENRYFVFFPSWYKVFLCRPVLLLPKHFLLVGFLEIVDRSCPLPILSIDNLIGYKWRSIIWSLIQVGILRLEGYEVFDWTRRLLDRNYNSSRLFSSEISVFVFL